MFKGVVGFGRKKSSRPFKEEYSEWLTALEKTHLPQLQDAMVTDPISPSLLSIHVKTIHQHFQAYYDALDLAASEDIAQVLYPEWRNSLEKPFLFLGDLHPYLLTNLLRSFLDEEEEEEEEEEEGGEEEGGDAEEALINVGRDSEFFERPYDVLMAFRSPSRSLLTRVDQIECGLRLMVPALVARARNAQAGFVENVGAQWGGGKKEPLKMLLAAQMEDLGAVFVDANRLRRSVLSDILSVANVYQAAVFLEGLAHFLLGFKNNTLLREFDKCKLPNS